VKRASRALDTIRKVSRRVRVGKGSMELDTFIEYHEYPPDGTLVAMRKSIRLRSRLYLSILPLVIVVVIVSAALSTLESGAAMTRIANRFMAFKAELLRSYFFSEWDVITSLGLEGQAAYRTATEESFRSYAYSLLRSPTEIIAVFDSEGQAVMEIQLHGTPRIPAAGDDRLRSLEPGWFSRTLFGAPRVGVAFDVKPFGWTVAVTELQSAFFSEVSNIERTHIWVLMGSTVAMMLFLSLFIRRVTGPVERLAGTIYQITVTNDLGRRAEIEFADEIGTLAHRFNTMISSLKENQRRLEAAIEAEREARQTVAEREQETLNLLGRVSDFRDEETGAHLRRIGELSALLSKLLGQSEEQQNLMRYSAPLHDIGKVGMPDAILQKQGRFSEEELEKMTLHTLFGHDLLAAARSEFLVVAAEIALTHHEKWDGTGYPAGLAGNEIPLSGRIVSIVDVFDALTSQRRYKEAWSPEHALTYIVEQSGRHFDPALVAVFERNFPDFQECVRRRDGGASG
jgi:HD-GYP domain-containing protein (c-di-GMP phosphodiesterase class II)